MKKFLKYAFVLLLATLIIVTVVACNGEKNTGDNDNDLGTDGTNNIVLEGFVSETSDEGNAVVYRTEISNSTANFSFANVIQAVEGATWKVSTDATGQNIVDVSQEDNLTVGDNVFYVTVTKGEVTEVYTVVVKRLNKFTVTFDTSNGTRINSQEVEEGGLITPVTTTRDGYSFVGWDYDFNTPVTTDLTVTASWAKLYTKIDANGAEDPNGDYIYFGEFPQTIKARTVEIPIDANPDNRGYYLGNDGAYYAKVKATPYDMNKYKFSNGTAVVDSLDYYFKVEPIKWRILKTESGNALLLCESILESKIFASSSNNSYENSAVRNWLINSFYDIAFTDGQKAIIQTTETIADKVFLADVEELTNLDYRFNPDVYETDEMRTRMPSDYSKARGAFVQTDISRGGVDNGTWWLRTPDSENARVVRYVTFEGVVGFDYTEDTGVGVVPSLVIKIG
jgi:hypothetical protein